MTSLIQEFMFGAKYENSTIDILKMSIRTERKFQKDSLAMFLLDQSTNKFVGLTICDINLSPSFIITVFYIVCKGVDVHAATHGWLHDVLDLTRIWG